MGGFRSTTIYDSKGNLTQYTNAEGGVWTLTYDSSGHPWTITNPLSKTTQFEYDTYKKYHYDHKSRWRSFRVHL